MTPYQPNGQTKNFIYSVQDKALFTRTSVSVDLPAFESLIGRNAVYNAVTRTAEKKYDHTGDPDQKVPYTFNDNFMVEIISDISIPYTPDDPEGFKNKLRDIMANSYIVISTVNLVNGNPDTGGSSSNEIDKRNEITIT